MGAGVWRLITVSYQRLRLVQLFAVSSDNGIYHFVGFGLLYEKRTIEFSQNVFTEFAEFGYKNIREYRATMAEENLHHSGPV